MRSARRAVIGSGVAGLTAAHVLSKSGPVTLYEADHRLGGHAHTHEVELDGRTINVDTGFIVHNDRTYPTLVRLFTELGVATQDTEMSMSVRCDDLRLEYAGAKGPRGLFPVARNLVNPSYLRLLGEVRRFHREARALLDRGPRAHGSQAHGPAADSEADSAADFETLAGFAERLGFSDYFARCFLEPVVAAVWSCDPAMALQYPARYLFEFLDHHGMLTVFGSPTWRTVVGGSARYVERVAAGIDEVRLGTPVHALTERAGEVLVQDARGEVEAYDAVVVATHPAQALAMLTEPTAAQRDALAAIPYSRNVAQLHTDESVLPRSDGARAAWNYWQRPAGAEGVLVTYDMTRLQRLDTGRHRLLVTLNGVDRVDQDKVISTMHYEHPIYTPESVAAQARLAQANTARVVFAGAYHGWGFHEDGARSGVAAAQYLGASWDGEPELDRLEATA